VVIEIVDIFGREAYSQKMILYKGVHNILLGNLKTKGIVPGVYFLQVISSQDVKSTKFV
jgi:hypothetical protein